MSTYGSVIRDYQVGNDKLRILTYGITIVSSKKLGSDREIYLQKRGEQKRFSFLLPTGLRCNADGLLWKKKGGGFVGLDTSIESVTYRRGPQISLFLFIYLFFVEGDILYRVTPTKELEKKKKTHLGRSLINNVMHVSFIKDKQMMPLQYFSITYWS